MSAVACHGPWLGPVGADADVVVSSRVRLARNIDGFPFCNRASTPQRRDLVDLVHARTTATPWGSALQWINMETCSLAQRQLLLERHLVSKQFAESDAPRSVALDADDSLAVMVNEEDHLRIQALRSGFRLDEAFASARAFDQGAESVLDFAFHERWGYLTACPTNVGCGIRASVMLHLPGLRITDEIKRVRRAAGALNLALRGFHGEGSEPMGDFFQLSNQVTLGLTEESVIAQLRDRIVPEVVQYERLARATYQSRKPVALRDRFRRSAATLLNAELMGLDEAMKLLGRLRLGIAMGLTTAIDYGTVHRLLLHAQPAHLALVRANDAHDTALAQDASRASLLRESLAALRPELDALAH